MVNFGELIGWAGSGLALGVVSAPHCMAMCGPVAAAACSRSTGPKRGTLAYQAGRVLGYGAGGALLGTLGAEALRHVSTPWAQAAVTWALALALLLSGVDLLLRWRRGRRSNVVAAPVSIGRGPSDGPGQRKKHALALTTLFGAATVFIPCGVLWGALILAASTGSMLGGTAVMLGFVAASGAGLAVASYYAARLSQGLVRFAPVIAGLCLCAAVLLAARPLRSLWKDPGAPPADCCSAGAALVEGDR